MESKELYWHLLGMERAIDRYRREGDSQGASIHDVGM